MPSFVKKTAEENVKIYRYTLIYMPKHWTFLQTCNCQNNEDKEGKKVRSVNKKRMCNVPIDIWQEGGTTDMYSYAVRK